MAAPYTSKKICVGAITGAHGIRGEVKLRSYTADPASLTDYGPLTSADGLRVYQLKIRSSAGDSLIAAIEGVSDRNAAEKLRGTELYVDRGRLPQTAEDEYYYEDLVGLRVLTISGDVFGTVHQVHNFGAGDLVEIAETSGQKNLYAFNDKTFPNVDLAAGTLTISLPEFIEPDNQP
jgi:16S rRNA processing protein RimM